MIDFHLLAILAICTALALVLPVDWAGWGVLAVAVIPQGLILTRVFHNRPPGGNFPMGYLIANEALVALAISVTAGLTTA